MGKRKRNNSLILLKNNIDSAWDRTLTRLLSHALFLIMLGTFNNNVYLCAKTVLL